MSPDTLLILIAVFIAATNLFFGLIRTYYAQFSKKTYTGSVDYWASWQKRKFDVAAQVLKEMGVDSSEDMKKLLKVMERKDRKKKGKKKK